MRDDEDIYVSIVRKIILDARELEKNMVSKAREKYPAGSAELESAIYSAMCTRKRTETKHNETWDGKRRDYLADLY